MHTLQCARPLAGQICIPYRARTPWDSPCLGAVHFGGLSEGNFAYLTVRAALGRRIFATFALHIGLGVEAGRQKLHTLTHELPLEFTRPLRGAGPRARVPAPVETKRPFVKLAFHEVRFCSWHHLLFWDSEGQKIRKTCFFAVRARVFECF